MAELDQTAQPGGPQQTRDGAAPAVTLEQNIVKMQQLRLGGFKLLETTIDGADNLNPERKAKRQIFLTEAARKRDRDALKRRLQLWQELLSVEGETVIETAKKLEGQIKQTEELYKSNLLAATEAVREMESTYRGVALFFANAETSGQTVGMKIRNISFLNAGMEQLDPADVYNNQTVEYVKTRINQVYNKFDLSESFSLMVIPGYLGSKMAVDSWAKIAHDHKLTLVTDYRDMDNLKDILTEFRREKIAADSPRYANVLMSCNYLVGRGKYDDLGEYEDLYVPPSTALAGKIHVNLISQVSAGLKFGALEQVDGVKFELLKTEVGELEALGLIPMDKDFGKVIPFSGKTLYSGSNIGLKTYSVVRVFDWVMKVLMQFLNKRAMENWDGKIQRQLTEEIIDFLDQIKGPGKIIESYEVPKFKQDPLQKDRILVDLTITPFFPAKTFIIGLHGEQGMDPNTGRAKGQYEPRDEMKVRN
jgi:hypothetical protein